MHHSDQIVDHWAPVQAGERYAVLDLLRGFALFGVLLVNLLYFFRVPLLGVIQSGHATAIDWLVGRFIEFKAFGLFSLSFGIGAAIQAERAAKRGVPAQLFLLRRFLVLLAIGAIHMLLLSNVDILMLYAVCGFVVAALIRLPVAVLLAVGLAFACLPGFLPGLPGLPPSSEWNSYIAGALRTYRAGSVAEILQFRWHERQHIIFPLLAGVFQRTLGLMLTGAAIWRAGVVREPSRYRRVLQAVLAAGFVIGLLGEVTVALVFAYAAGLLLWNPRWAAPVAAAGRMALTNYLTQTVVLGLVFYSYGLGLFGQMGEAAGTMLAIVLYAAQLAFSVWWLRRFRFGPCEWVWRSLTYGRRPPFAIRT